MYDDQVASASINCGEGGGGERGGGRAQKRRRSSSSTAHQAQIIKLTGKGTIMCVIVLVITTGELPKETRK